jgi:hypothetical protein
MAFDMKWTGSSVGPNVVLEGVEEIKISASDEN